MYQFSSPATDSHLVLGLGFVWVIFSTRNEPPLVLSLDTLHPIFLLTRTSFALLAKGKKKNSPPCFTMGMDDFRMMFVCRLKTSNLVCDDQTHSFPSLLSIWKRRRRKISKAASIKILSQQDMVDVFFFFFWDFRRLGGIRKIHCQK